MNHRDNGEKLGTIFKGECELTGSTDHQAMLRMVIAAVLATEGGRKPEYVPIAEGVTAVHAQPPINSEPRATELGRIIKEVWEWGIKEMPPETPPEGTKSGVFIPRNLGRS